LTTVIKSGSKAEKNEATQKKMKDFLNLVPQAPSMDYINRQDAEAALHFTTTIIWYIAKELIKNQSEIYLWTFSYYYI
jgi:hypothetical protein